MKNSTLVPQNLAGEPNAEAMASLWEEVAELLKSRQAANQLIGRRESEQAQVATPQSSPAKRVQFSHD